jgi:hypothetical protein
MSSQPLLAGHRPWREAGKPPAIAAVARSWSRAQASELVKAVAVFRLDDSAARDQMVPARNATARPVAVATVARNGPEGKFRDDWTQS